MSKADAAAEIEAAFRRTGVRRTPQRFFVLEHLLAHPEHATVEELWAALNKRHARASRATVYNTLHALVDAGLVRELPWMAKRRVTTPTSIRTIISFVTNAAPSRTSIGSNFRHYREAAGQAPHPIV